MNIPDTIATSPSSVLPTRFNQRRSEPATVNTVEVHLPYRIKITTEYLSQRFGLHRSTALTMVMNALGTIASGSALVEWHGGPMPLNMQLVMSPALLAENNGWANFLSAPLEREIQRLQKIASSYSQPDLLKKRDAMIHAMQNTTRADSCYDKVRRGFVEIGEAMEPWLLFRRLPNDPRSDFHALSLILDDTGDVLHQAINDRTGSIFEMLSNGKGPSGDPDWQFGSILTAPPQGFSRMLSTSCPRYWSPIVLPCLSSLNVGRIDPSLEDGAAQVWADVVSEALVIRRRSAIQFWVSEYGQDVVNRMIRTTDEMIKSVQYRGKFQWVAKTTVKLATIYHIMSNALSPEVHKTAWDASEKHVRALLNAHAEAISAVKTRVMGPPASNGLPGDYQKLLAYTEKHPGASLRTLVRALAKRKRGYWRDIYDATARIRDGQVAAAKFIGI